MLSMSNVGSVAAASSYYAGDNYYTLDEHQAHSAWEGQGAASLGLAGEVNVADFEKILSGEVDGQQLGKIVGRTADGALEREHRPGFDVTLSAPKSVSILAEVGGFKDARIAHEVATSKVLDYIEKNLAGTRVMEHGVLRFQKTDNIVAARFHHTTSRDLDPQTHTHLVIANATRTQDGIWRSFSNEELYKNQKLLGAIYDSALASTLRTMGYKLETTQDGRFEVAGITREQIEHFSQRSQAINERLEAKGLTRDTATAAEREDAALKTRGAKQADVDHQALRESWRERAAHVGIDFAKITAEKEAAALRPIDGQFVEDKALAAVRFAVAHLTERESVVPRRELLATALTHAVRETAWANVTLEQVSRALDGEIKAGKALVADNDSITTKLALEREQSMLDSLKAGRDASPAITTPARVTEAIERYEQTQSARMGQAFSLTSGQEDAARLALTSADRFIALQGYAGVGKTTMLSVVNQVATQEGYLVRGMASSASAAQTLASETGIQSSTTASFQLEEGRRVHESTPREAQSGQTAGPRRELWVLDEASLAGQREVTTLMQQAEQAGAKLLLVGDKLQLNAVEAGKPFELLQRAGIASAAMTEINRQRTDVLREAVSHAVERNNALSLQRLSDRIIEEKDHGALLNRIAADILGQDQTTRRASLLIVPLNAQRATVNDLVRQNLQARGDIARDAGVRKVLVQANFTDVQKASAVYYEPEMVVRFGRDYEKSLGVRAGDYASVVSIDRDTKTVTLQDEKGRQFAWQPHRHGKVEAYVSEDRKLAIGDELRFTRNLKEIGVANGTPGVVTDITKDTVTVQTASASITLNAGSLKDGHVDYAYAMTVAASQGRTANETHALITSDSGRAMGERAYYVTVTRARDDIAIYTDDKLKAEKIISQSQDKTSAIEHLQSSTSDKSRTDDVTDSGTKRTGSGGRGQQAEL